MITAVALLILAVLSLVGLAMLDLSFRDVQVSANLNSAAQALHAAEAGIEDAYRQIKVATALKANPGQNADGSITLTHPVIANHTFTTLTAVPLFFDAVITTQPTTQAQTIASGTLVGLNSFAQNYLVTSEVSGPNGSRAKVVQVLQMGFAPLFQFAVYYNEILEIFPGANFSIVGRAHSNNHIYIGGPGTGENSVDSFLTSAQNIYRRRFDNGALPPQPVRIKDAEGMAGTYRDLIKDSTDLDWTTWAIATYKGRVRDSAIGGTSLSLPLDASIQPHDIIEQGSVSDIGTPLETERMYWKADYRILVDSAGAVTVKTGPPGSETTVALDTSPFLTTTKEFVDKRENKCQDVAEIDVGALRTAAGWSLTKGILHVSSAKAKAAATTCNGSGSWSHTAAVRLTNGSQLPSSTEGGFTVVTDRPIYIRGDYNTLSTSGAAHNGNDATTPPAAVMADAVTVLSNAWTTTGAGNYDTKGNNPVGDRNASSTSIYAGMISGIKATGGSGCVNNATCYSGGLENYFRLLENWSGDTLTYRGSMVMLYQSEIATGTWQQTGQYYNPPTRDWAFDTLFKDKPPPGTPTLHVPQRVGWWHQE